MTFHLAEFEQPKGALNPMGLNLPGRIVVEVYRRAGAWYARTHGTKRDYPGVVGVTAEGAQSQAKLLFRNQVKDWQELTAGGTVMQPAPTSDAALIDDGGPKAKTDADQVTPRRPHRGYTHASNSNSPEAGRKHLRAWCGKMIDPGAVAVEFPTCAQCARMVQAQAQGGPRL